MILRLDTPVVPRTIVTMRVVRWHAALGDEVAFGDVLVELQTEQGMKRLLDVDGRISQPGAPAAEVDHSGDLVIPKPPQHHIELVASDAGVIRHVLAPEGHIVSQGDPLAVLSSTADEPVAEPIAEALAAALPFRAVADIVRIGVDLAEEY